MEIINESIFESQNSPNNPFLDKFSVDFTEDDDNETVIDFEFNEENQTIDGLNQIQKVIEGLDDQILDQNNGKQKKDNDSDIEIVANCSEDEFLMGSQLMADKLLKNRPNIEPNIGPNVETIDVHKECLKEKQIEKQKRVQMEMELELERQQRIEFQKQLEEYMNYSLRKQFQDSRQIKTLKFELLKCKNKLQELKKSVNNFNDFDINSNESTNNSKEKEFNCLDCSLPMKSEVSLILHLINHCIEEEEFRLETTVFRLDEFSDSMIDSIRKSVCYCCPHCNQSLNCLEIYYHIYKYHTKEVPMVCTKCKVYCTHIDYWRQHNQTIHNGVIASVTYIDVGKQIRNKSQPQRPQTNKTQFKSYSNGISGSNTYRPYSKSRPNHTIPPNHRNTQNRQMSSKAPTSDDSTEEDKDSEPEVIQLSDSPTPQMPVQRKPSSLSCGPKSTTVSADFECDFPDCDFKTTSKEKLEFHTNAHTNSKYKCPYCAYVGNILNDIYRHIQKSKKHDGLKVYECRDCSFGTNCLSTFKEHLNKKHFDNDSDEDEDIDQYISDMFRNEHCNNGHKSDSS